MQELLFIVQFIVGLVAIVKGADWLTDGAANIAQRFGIPTIVVGLTIVAMGSSMPEFVVSIVSAIEGNVDMALGNVVGSNIFNILAIIGVTALVKPIVADRRNVKYDVPFVILSSLFIVITAFDDFFGNEGSNSISRTDGLLMICTFIVFMSYTMSMAKGSTSAEITVEGLSVEAAAEGTSAETTLAEDSAVESAQTEKTDATPAWKQNSLSIGYIIVGLACLIIGGDWLVAGASGIAHLFGVSDSIIALTIVSAGTSAPELAASVMAAKKGDVAMALGNVVGSVVFNVFFVLGAAATICPLGIGGVTPFDILALLGASVIMWLLCAFWGKQQYVITRLEGAVMVVLAIAYYTILVVNS